MSRAEIFQQRWEVGGAKRSYARGLVKRSWQRIANWFIAVFQSLDARLQSAVMLLNASQISLLAASSEGKWPRVLMILRSRACTFSIEFEVYAGPARSLDHSPHRGREFLTP